MAISDPDTSMHGAAMMPALTEPADALVVLPVAVLLFLSAVLLMMRKHTRWQPFVAIPGLAAVLALDLALLAKVVAQGPQTMMMSGWKPPFGIAFTADLLGTLFLSVAGFVALACGIYASVAISAAERRYGFFPFLFLMMAGVSGAFLTGDVFNLYVWFEVLLIGSFGLIILGSRHEQLDGAIKYCFLNLVATTLFLVTTGLLYGVFGTLNMADIAVKAAAIDKQGAITTIAVLFLVAFGMKAAAFPLNFWLPASYHTPRFVVSALFAGLLTKVGIYALIRLMMVVFPLERSDLTTLIAWVAGLTMMVGALGALAQSDLRRLLNYMVVAGIGTIMAGLALPSIAFSDLAAGTGALGAGGTLQTGLSGSIFYALHSIVVMTALYLAAGVAAHRTGTSSLVQMSGLWERHLALSVLILVFLLSVSGLPPFSGFWPKVTLVRATIAQGLPWLAGVILVSGFLLTLASARIFALAVWRPSNAAGAEGYAAGDAPHRPEFPLGRSAMLPLYGLAAFVVAAGIWPEWLASLTEAAARGLIDRRAYIGSVFGGVP